MQKPLITGVAVVAGLAVVTLFFMYNSFAELTGIGAEQGGALVVQDQVVGSGEAAAAGDTVRVNYTGRLENGTVFDTTVGKTPIEFPLGVGFVIPGWDQGLVGMKEGGKRMLIIPPQLGYGAQDYGPIPGNSTLIFEVELVEVEKAQ
jgi:FKBP-type peptidyl-prolyl cis-trans isomerase